MLKFIHEEEEAIVELISKIDLDSYEPAGAIEGLSPKGRYSFRIVHQFSMLDSILSLAATIELLEEIEQKRNRVPKIYARAYRLKTNMESGAIFDSDYSYKEWLSLQKKHADSGENYKKVICLDIADFYGRIYFHRLENLFDEITPIEKKGASKFLLKHIKKVRVRQSFGIPIGNNSSRILAELAISDIDEYLRNYGIKSTRYVDDFRIFIGEDEDAYSIISLLAEKLYTSDGLTLNDKKTRIVNIEQFSDELSEGLSDHHADALDAALSSISQSGYDYQEIDERAIKVLTAFNLVEKLQEAISEKSYDFSRVRLILKALRLSPTKESIEFISANLNELIIFSRDIFNFVEAASKSNALNLEKLSNSLIDSVSSSAANSVLVIRSWLLEIFVRGLLKIDYKVLEKLEKTCDNSSRHQLHIIHGIMNDKMYFRTKKTNINSLSYHELPYFLYGATCLPDDEFNAWVKGIKPSLPDELLKLFSDWLCKNRKNLLGSGVTAPDEHFE